MLMNVKLQRAKGGTFLKKCTSLYKTRMSLFTAKNLNTSLQRDSPEKNTLCNNIINQDK